MGGKRATEQALTSSTYLDIRARYCSGDTALGSLRCSARHALSAAGIAALRTLSGCAVLSVVPVALIYSSSDFDHMTMRAASRWQFA